MTNKEVVQALRYCKFGVSCENCPAVGNEDCFDEVNTAAADLIERLTARSGVRRSSTGRRRSRCARRARRWIRRLSAISTARQADLI